MTTQAEVRERRLRVYRYRQRGLAIVEIARLEHRAPSRIKEDLRILKQEGRRFFTQDARLRERLANHFWDSLNALLEVEREAWLQYGDAKENVAVRLYALTVVHKVRRSINDLLGLTGLSLREMEREERLGRLEKHADEVEAALHIRQVGSTMEQGLRKP